MSHDGDQIRRVLADFALALRNKDAAAIAPLADDT